VIDYKKQLASIVDVLLTLLVLILCVYS